MTAVFPLPFAVAKRLECAQLAATFPSSAPDPLRAAYFKKSELKPELSQLPLFRFSQSPPPFPH